ncbi:telomere binding protein [Linderina macrospora]|uniref:Telomere binding protein n=1 Tax=Linderina macrospora TaxID=4868 RepID=A0ACC1JHS0_9FUNG|nr:telomere binding protein [Linderina macrospora]
MASVPGRVANAVEPQSIPIRLTQRQYFAAMARDTAELMASAAAAVTDKVSSMLRVRLVADLCAKMCRVGQTECLAVEIAARMLADVRDHGNKLLTAVLGNHDVDYEYGLLAGACKVLTRVAPPFGSRLVPAIVQQLDTVVCRVTAANEADGQVHGRLITEQVAVITASILFNYLDMDHSQPALDSAISSVARSPLGTYWSLPTYQAVALALQLLSGKATLQTDISLPFTRVFPDLLESALTGCLLPMWSQPDLVTYGQPEQCKALTVLVLSSIGAMDSKERMRVSQSTAFMRAIQKFLEAPTAMVKLSGIIVADAVVNSNVDGEKLDFGLDDIIAESKSSDVALGGSQPLMSASADYIAEMRRYLLPIKEQWSDRGTSVDDKDSKHMEAATTKAVDFIREYGSAVPVDDANADMVLAPRQSSLTVPQELGTKYIKPRTPVFLHDCFTYLNSNPPDSEKTKIGLFALTDCISNANTKTVDELWLRVANKLLYLYNRGPDHADWAWDQERRRALTALAVRLPMELGPFMADKSCDRNLTLKDREILFSAISNACLQLSGLGDDTVETPKERIVVVEPPISNAKPKSQEFGSGTVVRRSRKLDLAKQQQQQRQQQRQQLAVAAGSTKTELAKQRRQYASIVGPAFFFPLIAQYGKSDMTTSASDIRHDASMFAQYANTLGIILYTSGTSSHLIRMNREFWDLTKLVRKLKAKSVSESPAVLDALLFGIDVILSPDRALSAPTLANEFRADISDAVVWINSLVERSLLGESAMTHASRVIVRLDELQQDVRRRVMSSDIHQFSSII